MTQEFQYPHSGFCETCGAKTKTDHAKFCGSCYFAGSISEKKMLTVKPVLIPGDQVTHARLGTGVIKSEWGIWICCPECFGELVVKTGVIDNRRPTKLSNGMMKCPHCNREIDWGRTISGRGVFDVQFASGLHSINGCWLTNLSGGNAEYGRNKHVSGTSEPAAQSPILSANEGNVTSDDKAQPSLQPPTQTFSRLEAAT